MLDYPQPEYVNPIYDCYSHNYLSTRAMGRGNTGAALIGAVDHLLLNPAGYLPEKRLPAPGTAGETTNR